MNTSKNLYRVATMFWVGLMSTALVITASDALAQKGEVPPGQYAYGEDGLTPPVKTTTPTNTITTNSGVSVSVEHIDQQTIEDGKTPTVSKTFQFNDELSKAASVKKFKFVLNQKKEIVGMTDENGAPLTFKVSRKKMDKKGISRAPAEY